jgi:hypothetical protein
MSKKIEAESKEALIMVKQSVAKEQPNIGRIEVILKGKGENILNMLIATMVSGYEKGDNTFMMLLQDAVEVALDVIEDPERRLKQTPIEGKGLKN